MMLSALPPSPALPRQRQKGHSSTEDSSIASALTDTSVQSTASNVQRLPERLVDFFCVVGTPPTTSTTATAWEEEDHIKTGPTISETGGSHHHHRQDTFVPVVLDCYPKIRPDMEFPKHISKFCFPTNNNHDCRRAVRRNNPMPPTLWTTVLTLSNGHKLYSAILTFYEKEDDKARVKTTDHHETTQQENVLDIKKNNESPARYYHPKCLVVLSHYAQFDVLRQFLRQLYRIFISNQSPVPLERYVAHFLHDVPLPPAGKAVIAWDGFVSRAGRSVISIAQPPPNQLPLVNVSFQPLFRTLSVANILVIWGILLQEGRVVFMTEHVGLLTPITQALQSLLFPLQWQGMYIPVLPCDMVDVLDAPVPYIVGLHARYWKDSQSNNSRPRGVVFVDLDMDIVHLSMDEILYEPHVRLPSLPSREIMNLKVLLEEMTDHLYLTPASGLKGCIMTADGQVLENADREPYSQMTCLHFDMNLDGKEKKEENHRHFILATAERAVFDDDAPIQTSDFVLGNGRQEQRLTKRPFEKLATTAPSSLKREASFGTSMKRASRVWQAHTDRLMAFAGQPYATPNPFNMADSNRSLQSKRKQLARDMYELEDPQSSEHDGATKFSTMAVRQAFLSFFLKHFFRYKNFLQVGKMGEIRLDRDAFIKDLHILSTQTRHYMLDVVGTQMFERFIHDRSRRKLLFDEYIVTERNRCLNPNKQIPTPFLDDTRWHVRKTIHPKAPNAQGVPVGMVFAYTAFPQLDEQELLHATAPLTPSWETPFLCDGSIFTSCLGWSEQTLSF